MSLYASVAGHEFSDDNEMVDVSCRDGRSFRKNVKSWWRST
jgi:hypothetical protein